MTIAIDRGAVSPPVPDRPHGHPATPPRPASGRVAALLFAETIDDLLIDVLVGIADQSDPAETLVVVDATGPGDLARRLGRNAALVDDLPPLTVVRVTPGTPARQAVRQAVREARAAVEDAEGLWFLDGGAAPDKQALRHLRCTLFGSPNTGIAGPKLVQWHRPDRLVRLGIQVTRAGRLRLSPRAGEPDQGQYDHVADVLAVPAVGMLVRRRVLDDLQGHDTGLGDLGSDLDFGWRAQLAGHRVVLSPRARVRVDTHADPAPTRTERRDARRVALARTHPFLSPFLALWIVVSSVLAAVGLLLLKRPAAAWRAVGDSGSVLTPWRIAGSWWRTRRQRTLRRTDLRGLFVSARDASTLALERLRDVVVPTSRRPHAGVSVTETGPSEAAEDPLSDDAHAAQLVRNPGLWAALCAAAVALAAGRTLPGGLLGGINDGFEGGELTGSVGDAASAWHAAWDGWHGPGPGTGGPPEIGLAVLAAPTWVIEHLPGLGSAANPLGATLGLAVVLALPLSVVTAYVAGRVVTRRPWPRALAALAWATSPVAIAALAQGRLGALALLLVLPLVLAGCARVATPGARPGAAPATALAAGLLATVVPGVLVVLGAILLMQIVLGRPRTRRRAAGTLVMATGVALPIVPILIEHPGRLLTGWGLVDSRPGVPLGHVLLLQPDPQGLAWASLPILLIGLVAIMAPVRRVGLAGSAAALCVGGLALALVLPRVTMQGGFAGWPGLGHILVVAGLVVAGLVAVAEMDGRASAHRGRRYATRSGGALAVAGVLAAATVPAWSGLDTTLEPAADPRPAVAIDQAFGPSAGRTLLVTLGGGQIAYDVLGRESAAPARDLPVSGTPLPGISDAVGSLFDESPSGATESVDTLAAWGIGFLVLDGDVTSANERRLDATAGLIRIGDHDGTAVWRVDAGSAGPPTASRLRLATSGGATVVPVSGSHAATSADLTVPAGARLDVAEPTGWAGVAEVRANGLALEARTGSDGRPAYDLPVGDVRLDITVPPRYPLLAWCYLSLLALLAYLAVPLGSAPGRRP